MEYGLLETQSGRQLLPEGAGRSRSLHDEILASLSRTKRIALCMDIALRTHGALDWK